MGESSISFSAKSSLSNSLSRLPPDLAPGITPSLHPAKKSTCLLSSLVLSISPTTTLSAPPGIERSFASANPVSSTSLNSFKGILSLPSRLFILSNTVTTVLKSCPSSVPFILSFTSSLFLSFSERL